MITEPYTSTDWASFRSRKRLDSVRDASELFTNKCAITEFDSHYAGIRESRDNVERQATPVIVGFDVTGKNGYIAKELVTHVINDIVDLVSWRWSNGTLQFMFAAIGDVKCDNTPLQVTNFRSDIGMYDELMKLHIEGGGIGDGASYNLLWYMAGRCVKTDLYEKRGRKGFLFTIGNNRCYPDLSVVEIGKAFGDEAYDSIPSRELFEQASEKFNICHINLSDGTPENRSVFKEWREFYPASATEIKTTDIIYLPELMGSIISYVSEGNVQSIMKSFSPETAVKLARPLGFVINDNRSGGSVIF